MNNKESMNNRSMCDQYVITHDDNIIISDTCMLQIGNTQEESLMPQRIPKETTEFLEYYFASYPGYLAIYPGYLAIKRHQKHRNLAIYPRVNALLSALFVNKEF